MLRISTFACLFAFALQLALAPAASVSAQESDAPAGGAADMEEAMKAYLELSKPGPEHAKLKMRVGNWKVAGTFYMAPDAPPMKSEATSNIRPLMEGRYFREQYAGDFMGMKFTGIGVFGYDKGAKKYFSTWIDSMSTGLMRSDGVADASGDVITYVGEYFDPQRNATVKQKYVLTLKSRKTHSSAVYEVAADGSERKIMDLVYTRTKREAGAKGKNAAGKAKRGQAKKDPAGR